MKRSSLVTLVLWFVFISVSTAQKINYDSLGIFIEKLMSDFEIPGLGIAIVDNDSVAFLQGYGQRELAKKDPVSENTIFGIGSISKSFTALTLAMLVDEGKITWEDKVRDHISYFELYDPYVTENYTIRDLLTHRSGLPAVSGGTLWYHSDLSREDMIRRLKYLEPVSGFRYKPAYQNVMFVVAGEIVQQVTGMSWDDFLKSRVFDKLGMISSTSVSAIREKNSDLARPHIWNEDHRKVSIEQERGDNLAEAGFIYSSAKDMAKYIRLLLNDGVFEGDTLVNAQVLNELFTPQIIFPLFGRPIHNEFTSYGMGWWLTPRQGHKIIEHSGGIDGMTANLVMVRDMDFGAIIMTNESEEFAVFLLTFRILEEVMNDPSYDMYDRLKENRDRRLMVLKNGNEDQTQIKNTRPSLDLSSYAGTYTDRMYGDIMINMLKDGALELSFSHTPLFSGKLMHWHYDTFKIDWYDIRIPDGFLTFNFNSEGEITGFTLDQKELLDVDFSELDIRMKISK